MNALQILQSWGFPRGVDNTRIKPGVIYDTQTIAAGTLEYNYFNTNPSNIFDRNKQLPLSGDETMLIDGINIIFENAAQGFTLIANFTEVLTRSYLEIMVNDTQKIKIPLLEAANFVFANTIGNNTVNFKANYFSRTKKLQYPIILFKRANTQFRIVLTANAATALNASAVKLQLSGVKLDFVIPNELDPVANNKYEKLSTTLFNTPAIVAAANTYNLFSDRTLSPNVINKTFPLGDNEIFSIEAIEIVNFATNVSGNFAAHLNEAQQQVLKIGVNQTEYYFGSNSFFNTLFYSLNTTFSDAGAVNTNIFVNDWISKAPEVLGLVSKGTPILIPSSSQVDITLQQPATNLTNFVMVMLKGTLERRIS